MPWASKASDRVPGKNRLDARTEPGQIGAALQTFTITLPTSSDPFGKWLEENGGRVSIGCSLGNFDVEVTWCKVHSYSDDRGVHRETWTLSRSHKVLPEAFRLAMEAAQKQTTKP